MSVAPRALRRFQKGGTLSLPDPAKRRRRLAEGRRARRWLRLGVAVECVCSIVVGSVVGGPWQELPPVVAVVTMLGRCCLRRGAVVVWFGNVGKQGGKVGFVEACHQFQCKLPPAGNERCVFDVGGGGEAKTCVGDGIE